MAQLREIKRRIRSVTNTQQITRAMKLVAAAKLNRAQERMKAMRPYAEKMNETLRFIALDLVGDEHPLFQKRAKVKSATHIVIAGDRGLCGGFNSNLLRAVTSHLADHAAETHSFIAIGKRASQGLRKSPHPTETSYHDVFESLSYLLSQDICSHLVAQYLSKGDDRRDGAYLVYNEFHSVISQKPVVKRLLPLDYQELIEERKAELATQAEDAPPRSIYEIEPDVETTMRNLIARRLATQVHSAILESYAAELAARMTAMDSATNNAGDMIDRLSLEYNRARQAGITGELLDIIGGANAIS